MKEKIVLIPVLVLLAIFTVFVGSPAQAQCPQINFQVATGSDTTGTAITSPLDTSSPCLATGNLNLFFPTGSPFVWTDSGGTTRSINIVSKTNPQNPAQVSFDETGDKLMLFDAQISPNQNATNTIIHITFWRQFDGLSSPDVWYQVDGTGNLKRGQMGARNDWLTLRGEIVNPPGTTTVIGNLPYPPPLPPTCTPAPTLTKCVVVSTVTSGQFSVTGAPQFLSNGEWNPINDVRTLQGEFWFNFTQGTDTLFIDETQGIKVSQIPPPGPCPANKKLCDDGKCRKRCPTKKGMGKK